MTYNFSSVSYICYHIHKQRNVNQKKKKKNYSEAKYTIQLKFFYGKM